MLLDAGENLGIAKFLMLGLIERGKSIELGATVGAGYALRIVQVKNGIALAAQKNALMFRGKKAGSPKAAEQALFAEVGFGVHHNIARKVVVHSPETVTQPGP